MDIRALGVGTSAVVAGGRALYAKDALTFADFDGDGEEELLTVFEPETHPRDECAAVLRWTSKGSALVEWKKPLTWTDSDTLLVGDIDEDPLPEIVLFDRKISGREIHVEPPLVVVQWDGQAVAETEHRINGSLGLLADTDADGRDELVLVRTRVDKFDVIFEEPSDLVAYDYRDGRFVATHKRELAVGVQAFTAVDLNGDGRQEIVTSETSFEGTVNGRLSVYRFEPNGVVSVAYRRNGVMAYVKFLGAFRTGGQVHLLAATRRGWQAVFRLGEGAGAFHLTPVGAGASSLPVFEAARLATAAYSAEQDMFLQFAEGDRARLVPVRPAR